MSSITPFVLPIKVSLHPRMRSHAYRRMFPSAWEIIGTQTHSPICDGMAKAVVQHGSGVGLEALSMGLDVIDLCHPQDRPNYPYIIEPYVQIVHDVSSLQRWINCRFVLGDDLNGLITPILGVMNRASTLCEVSQISSSKVRPATRQVGFFSTDGSGVAPLRATSATPIDPGIHPTSALGRSAVLAAITISNRSVEAVSESDYHPPLCATT